MTAKSIGFISDVPLATKAPMRIISPMPVKTPVAINPATLLQSMETARALDGLDVSVDVSAMARSMMSASPLYSRMRGAL